MTEPPIADPGYKALLELCKSSHDYPRMATTWNKSLSKIELERQWEDLRKMNLKLFEISDPGCIVFWEIAAATLASTWAKWTETTTGSMADLSKHLHQLRPDPRCRHIFITSRNECVPLNCSLEMAKLLFTFHQVDPSFLGFVYNLYFGYGYQHADFSISKFLPAIDTSPTPSTFLNRSGRVICHSFLLRGVQEGHDWREDCCNDSWVRLQVVAYHSFDIKTGTMTWITLRASSELTGRIRVADSKSFAKLDSIDNVEGAFEASLTTHLTYIDWSAANWVYLANEIDRRLRDTLWVLKVITSTPYEPDMRTTYRSPYRQGRTIMRLAKRRSPYSLVVEEIYLRGTEDEDRAAGFFLRPFSNHDVCGVMHHGLAPLLERLQRLDLDLELNIDALNSMCQRYEGLKTDQDLGSELPRASKTSIDKFVSRVRLIIDNLTGRQKHLLSLQSRIREARTLYESIARFRTAESNMDDDIPPCPEPESAQPKEE